MQDHEGPLRRSSEPEPDHVAAARPLPLTSVDLPEPPAGEKPAEPESAVSHTVKVFDRDVKVSPENLTAISHEISQLLRSDNLNHMFLAARKLAQARRLGVIIEGDKDDPRGGKWGEVYRVLNSNRGPLMRAATAAAENAGKPGVDAQMVSQYLSYLKSLDMLEGVTGEEAKVIRDGLEVGQAADADTIETAAHARHIGALDKAHTEPLVPGFEKELERAHEANNTKALARGIARLNYLWVSSKKLDTLISEANPKISQHLEELKDQKKWDELAKTYVTASYTAAPKLAVEPVAGELVQHVEALRSADKWSQLTSYVGSLKKMSQFAAGEKAPDELPDIAEEKADEPESMPTAESKEGADEQKELFATKLINELDIKQLNHEIEVSKGYPSEQAWYMLLKCLTGSPVSRLDYGNLFLERKNMMSKGDYTGAAAIDALDAWVMPFDAGLLESMNEKEWRDTMGKALIQAQKEKAWPDYAQLAIAPDLRTTHLHVPLTLSSEDWDEIRAEVDRRLSRIPEWWKDTRIRALVILLLLKESGDN